MCVYLQKYHLFERVYTPLRAYLTSDAVGCSVSDDVDTLLISLDKDDVEGLALSKADKKGLLRALLRSHAHRGEEDDSVSVASGRRSVAMSEDQVCASVCARVCTR